MPRSLRKSSVRNSSKGSEGPAPDESGSSPGEIRWVIVELSSSGEREADVSQIESAVRRLLRLKDLRVFVPAVSQSAHRDDSQTLFFMEGYVFVEYRVGVPYLNLRDTNLFRDVLCDSVKSRGAKPGYSLLSDSSLDPMRDGMQEMKNGSFRIGDRVRVITGSYKNLRGEIIALYDDGQKVQLSINHLISKSVLIDFPSTYLVRAE